MPEARDRVERPADYAAIFSNRRRNGVLLLDEADSRLGVFEHPVRGEAYPQPVRGVYSSWRPGSGNGSGHSPFRSSHGRENLSRARPGASRSSLPSWYPRTPLRDITHVMRAIERKRRAGGVRVDDSLETHGVLEAPVASADEDNCVMVTPAPAVGFKRSFPPSTAKVHKMLLDISKEITEEEAGFITPEKKLLNSIDIVEKIVMAEILKLKSTPLAKREEREKRVKTLMSMR